MAALIAAAIATVGPVDRENVRLMLVISEREGGDDAGLEFRHEGRSNHQ
jgi:hypothetical protein